VGWLITHPTPCLSSVEQTFCVSKIITRCFSVFLCELSLLISYGKQRGASDRDQFGHDIEARERHFKEVDDRLVVDMKKKNKREG
jgi:hypothetical protein